MTPRDRRALVIGGAVVAAAFLALRAVPWGVRELESRRDALAAKHALLARVRADLRDAEWLADSAPEVERQVVALAPRVLNGGREPEAVADLVGQVSRVASEHKLNLVRTVPVPDSERAGRLRRAAVRASLEGDTRGTLAMLAALAAGTPVLTVREIRITASDPRSVPSVPEVLQSDLVVAAWYVEGGEAATGPKP
jgi:hypothetical protein